MPHRQRLNIVAILGVLAHSVACVDEPTSSITGSQHPRRALAPAAPQHYLSVDDEFAAIAAAESSFGGMYLDSTRTPVVYLTDTSRLSAARDAGVDASLSRRRIPTGNYRVVEAAYGFGTLERWYAKARSARIPGLIFEDLDERHNRLHFGVLTASQQQGALPILTGLGIPRAAVAVDVMAPLAFASTGVLNNTIQDSVRPVRGGIQILSGGSGGSYCTLGFVARGGYNTSISEDSLLWFTAAHCDAQSSAGMYQDTIVQWAALIGDVFDTSLNSSAACTAIGRSGSACRYSEMAKGNSGSYVVNTVHMPIVPGLIARTVNYSSSYSPGSLQLDLTDNGLFITGIASPPIIGDDVWKTGMATGTTVGYESATCVDDSMAGVWFVCQDDVHAEHGSGDSGAPVYMWNAYPADSVDLVGILWGRSTDSLGSDSGSDTGYVYSSISNIQTDLGTFNALEDSEHFSQPSPLSMSISGPTEVEVAGNYTWTAYPSGGSGTYGYQWAYVGGANLGTSQSQTESVSAGVSLQVTVSSSSPDSQIQAAVVVVSWNPITSVGLSGPTSVGVWTQCAWTATVSGGAPPYYFAWTGPTHSQTDTTSSSSDMFGDQSGSNFTISVTVSDNAGGNGSNSQGVNTYGYGC
jgi:hypothetical protein